MRWHVPVCLCMREGWGDMMTRSVFSDPVLFLAFQRHNGDILTTASVKHLSHRRFVVSFQLDSVQRTDQDLYRCVTQSQRGSGVSNFAELVVKGKHSLQFVSFCSFFLCLSVSFISTMSLPAVFFFMITRFCSLLGHSRLPPVTSDEDLKWTDHNMQWEPLLWTFQITRRTSFVHNGGNHRHLFQIDSHKIPSSQIVRCSTHMEALWRRIQSPPTCCFLSWSCQISCHTQLFSSLSKSCSLDLDSWSPCHIMYRRWWPHSHYSLQPHSLTPLWQHSNDMAVGWFDGITNSSPQQKEDETRHKDVKDPRPLLCAPGANTFLIFSSFYFGNASSMAVWMAILVCLSLWSRLK